MRGTYRSMVSLLAATMIVLGVLMLVFTLRHGGGVGIVLGLLFVGAGAGRLYLMRRRRGDG
jgi:hypothetical protein